MFPALGQVASTEGVTETPDDRLMAEIDSLGDDNDLVASLDDSGYGLTQYSIMTSLILCLLCAPHSNKHKINVIKTSRS